MKIAITGARGTVGKEVVKLCEEKGIYTVQVDRTEEKSDGSPNTERRTADIANDYEACLDAFQGCDAIIHLAAIPNPVDKDDAKVHNNNVNSAFNGFRAAGKLGIKKIAYASSVNAIGLAYANRPLHFDYFPLDEDCPTHPTDSYALAKNETELQARAFVDWFPGTKIACLRIHEVAPRADVAQEHKDDWEGAGVKQLWGWVHPVATARACLASIESADKFEGCEIFNINAPTTAQETSSRELAQKYYPNAKINGDWGKSNEGFWTTNKAERILGWKHVEEE
jgi:nucleoside-diphosphate-sugar epimerase